MDIFAISNLNLLAYTIGFKKCSSTWFNFLTNLYPSFSFGPLILSSLNFALICMHTLLFWPMKLFILFSFAWLFCLFISFSTEERFLTESCWVCSLLLVSTADVEQFPQTNAFIYLPNNSWTVIAVFSYHIWSTSNHESLSGRFYMILVVPAVSFCWKWVTGKIFTLSFIL